MIDERPAERPRLVADPASTRAGSRWLDVPTSLWAYALLRSVAFAAPAWSEGGRIGLGVVVIAALFVHVVRTRSRWAWQVIAFLDIVSALLLLATWGSDTTAAVAAPVLAASALVCLFLPASRRYVGA